VTQGPGREATRVISKHGRVERYVRKYRLKIRGHDGRESVKDVAQDVLRAGAQAGNDLILEDEAVSRIHFEIAAETLGFRLRDLGSTNGTFVDGNRVLDIYLKSGARIRAGRSTIELEVLDTEAQLPLDAGESFGPLLGGSAPMRQMFAILRRVAMGTTTVLIEGESGTGKELIAEAIHTASPRADAPFTVFDCSSVPATLMESELFGHEKGAFSGADTRRIGRIEEAEGGTLFLDEIGELPSELQPKLLRVVEAREYRPLGSTKVRKVDVRIVAATNRDLAMEVNRGTFRHDLYYRLAVVRVAVPPLRARTEDLPQLVQFFLRRAVADQTMANNMYSQMPPDVWELLSAYPWRGNVRELRNLIERSVAIGTGDLARDLAGELGLQAAPRAESPALATREGDNFQDAKASVLAEFERAYFAKLYADCSGNISEISRRSGMERARVRGYLRRHNLDRR
jgi:DNA-binding NtrC family response regulator